MKILLVEDDPSVVQVLLNMMQEWQMEAVFSSCPSEAMQVLDKDEFDLLIVDQLLPEMTGTDLVGHLRGTSRYQHLPVLMISGHADKQTIIKANEVGITEFLAKPMRSGDLRRRLLAFEKAQRHHVLQRQIACVWQGAKPSMHDIFSPHIVFGEPLSKPEDLGKPENRHLVPYLHDSCTVIEALNQDDPALQLGYVIEDNTADIMVPLVRHAAKKWIRLILISTRCPGKPILLVRLFTINGRADDMPVVLVYDKRDDLEPEERQGLKALGVKVRKRSGLSRDKLEQLISRHLRRRKRRKAKAPEASPEELLRSRILADIDAMTTLPILPQIYQRILELSRDPNSDIQDWVQAVQLDPMTCAVVFRWASSPSYGFKGRINDIGRAVILLGKDAIRNIVASQAMLQTFQRVEEQGFDLNHFLHHNLAVGYAAYLIGFPLDDELSQATHGKTIDGLGLAPEAVELLRRIDLPARLKLEYHREIPFIGGILHDLGKGVMIQAYPGLFPLLLAELGERGWGEPALQVEQDLTGGLTHPVVGGIVAGRWGLDEELCRVIQNHHQPEIDDTFTFLVSAADVIGQILHPFPKGPVQPLAEALQQDDLASATAFLPAGLLDTPLLDAGELTALARAVGPKVKAYTEAMSRSIQG